LRLFFRYSVEYFSMIIVVDFLKIIDSRRQPFCKYENKTTDTEQIHNPLLSRMIHGSINE
ncbi:hypothetical protein ABN070_10680, partial [Morganella morganii]|uniref:hypothetical protein n=1 Tax=Morganella morganii TaxID=582 RepID=UPI0032DAA529